MIALLLCGCKPLMQTSAAHRRAVRALRPCPRMPRAHRPAWCTRARAAAVRRGVSRTNPSPPCAIPPPYSPPIRLPAFLIMSTICGRPSVTLFTGITLRPAAASAWAVPRVATTIKTQLRERAADFHRGRFIAVAHADEHLARCRQLFARRHLRFDKRFAEGFTHAHYFAGRFHFRTQYRIGTGELDERKHRFFNGQNTAARSLS